VNANTIVAAASLTSATVVDRSTYDTYLSTFGSRLFSRTCDADMTQVPNSGHLVTNQAPSQLSHVHVADVALHAVLVAARRLA